MNPNSRNVESSKSIKTLCKDLMFLNYHVLVVVSKLGFLVSVQFLVYQERYLDRLADSNAPVLSFIFLTYTF